jgi:hypothetical protein
MGERLHQQKRFEIGSQCVLRASHGLVILSETGRISNLIRGTPSRLVDWVRGFNATPSDCWTSGSRVTVSINLER